MGSIDRNQVEVLCDELNARVETTCREQKLLEQLIAANAHTRPYRTRQYELLLREARARANRFLDLVVRYCRSPHQ